MKKSQYLGHRPMKGRDLSDLIGLPVFVVDGSRSVAIDGKEYTGIWNPSQLSATAAVARCQLPHRLQGCEIQALRKIMELTPAALAEAIGGCVTPATVVRWESGARRPGDDAERLLRILVCNRLQRRAPGAKVDLDALLALRLDDTLAPLSPMRFRRVPARSQSSDAKTWTYVGRRTKAPWPKLRTGSKKAA